MTSLSAIIAYNRPGTVGSASIYCSEVASRMVEQSQAVNAAYLKRRVAPAAIIHINLNPLNPLNG
jgi:hypothetical protein